MRLEMKHRILWVFGAMLLGVFSLHAQSNEPLFTQQMFQKVNFNPAAIRPDPVVDVSLFGRMQWVDFDGAPKSIMLNASGYMSEIRSGVSGSIIGESFGKTFWMNAKFGYSYHIHLGRMNYLSFGLSAGVLYKNFAGHEIKTEDSQDPYVNYEDVNDVKPDVDFGLMFTFNKFSLGLSATHLTAWAYNRKKDYFAPQEGYHAFMQFKGDISPKFAIDPYIAAHYVNGFIKAEGVVTFRFADVFWIGGGYRYNDAVMLMAGFKIGKVFSIGYSYDLGMGGLKKYHSGSHEIYLSLKFETTRKVGEVTDTPLMFE